MRPKSRITMPRQYASLAMTARRMRTMGKRRPARATNRRGPFLPPETWHEPRSMEADTYRIVTEGPGEGFLHVVQEDDVRDRLSELPEWMLDPLEIVQLSRMTRKKRLFPCYGMQWGSSLYLYPVEETLIETFDDPPKASVYNEARMYGGRWEQAEGNTWRLHWDMDSIRDFYLNNILIHELGHLLDQRNCSSVDRERFAEWFAIEHGYRSTQRARMARLAASRTLRRRHHAK